MSEVRILMLGEALATAERVLRDPDRHACRISIDERVTLCALVLQQHSALVAAGIAYPTRPETTSPSSAPAIEAAS